MRGSDVVGVFGECESEKIGDVFSASLSLVVVVVVVASVSHTE